MIFSIALPLFKFPEKVARLIKTTELNSHHIKKTQDQKLISYTVDIRATATGFLLRYLRGKSENY